MAKAGVYKSEIKKARESLVAQGKHPSVDAVRIALGNTGSKTTIHKYLKELDTEYGGADNRKVSISEALQDLVARLAAQLQDEANARIEAARAEQAELEHHHAETLSALQRDVAQWRDGAQQFEAALHDERAAHSHTRATLQQETIARHTAEQQVTDLKERLAENDAHRQSLEEKHRHARDALDHYRQSVKEQREQDQRRHEQQLQQLQAELRLARQSIVVKQEDVTRLNHEGARLVTELSHAQQALRDAQEHGRRLDTRIEALQATEQRCGILETQVAERETRMEDLRCELSAATAATEATAAQLQAAQLELVGAKATLSAQKEIVADLRAAMVPRRAKRDQKNE